MAEVVKMTLEEIEAAKSHRNGWSRRTLAVWGVPSPPPKGWRAALIAGRPFTPVDGNAVRSRKQPVYPDHYWAEAGPCHFICGACKVKSTKELKAYNHYRTHTICRNCNARSGSRDRSVQPTPGGRRV